MSSGTASRLLINSSTDFFCQLRLAFERVVHVGDVSLVMLGVMDLHRLRVDVRLERIVGVR